MTGDGLDELLSSLEMDSAAEDVEDVTLLSDQDLVRGWSYIQNRCAALGELTAPRTDEGRDLHSRWGAYKVEMVKRGLL